MAAREPLSSLKGTRSCHGSRGGVYVVVGLLCRQRWMRAGGTEGLPQRNEKRTVFTVARAGADWLRPRTKREFCFG